MKSFLLSFFLFGFSIQAFAQRTCSSLFYERPSLTRSLMREDYNKPTDFKRIDEYIEEKTRIDIFDRIDTGFSKTFDTRFWYSNTNGTVKSVETLNVVDPEAKAVFVFFHGSGTSQSSGKNFSGMMNSLAKLGFSSVSFDLPFHGDGPLQERYLHADALMRWLHAIIQKIQASGKPIYLVGHSFGPDVIAEYITRYPFDVNGALLISPAGFNSVLSDWYDKKTSKMKFGGEVPSNDAGGNFAGVVAQQFIWNKVPGVDPTRKNPSLKVQMLSGNREEYVPAPVGGARRTPVGVNTYNIGEALREYFFNLDYVIESGVGHYIFNHTDQAGHNVVMRETLRLAGYDVSKSKEYTTEMIRRWAARDLNEKAAVLYASDRNFQSWAQARMSENAFQRMVQNPANESRVKSVLEAYELDKARQETRILDVLFSKPQVLRDFIHINRVLFDAAQKDRKTHANPLLRALGIYLKSVQPSQREKVLDLFYTR